MVTTNTLEAISKGLIAPLMTGIIQINKIERERLSGTVLLSEKNILLERTEHPQNQALYQAFLSDLEKSENDMTNISNIVIHHDTVWEVERLKYLYLWDKY